MDLNKQKLLHKGQSNIGEAEDRISELHDKLLHHILSFLDDIKPVARTSLLSKRWKHIWTSIPTLVFPNWNPLTSLSEINKFMDFVDRTLHLHRASSIQKFSLDTHEQMNESRVHSWISSLTSCKVEEMNLNLNLKRPFFIPVSLFTCESLIKLELSGNNTTRLPRSFCFEKLKSIKLYGIQFTDNCWNEQHFYCPVLESLILEDCTWFGVRNFCISAPALGHLEIDNDRSDDDGLQNCALKIHAPNLVKLAYCGCVAKEYDFSIFETLEYARVCLICKDDVLPMEQKICYGAAVSKFFQALSYVERLDIYAESQETLYILHDFVNIPTFHDLFELILKEGQTTDKSLFLLLKAIPYLRWLTFDESCIDDNNEEPSWDNYLLTATCMFQHLEAVTFVRFRGNARQMRWMKLILKNAKALETFELFLRSTDAINIELLKSEFLSLPKASERCEFEFKEY